MNTVKLHHGSSSTAALEIPPNCIRKHQSCRGYSTNFSSHQRPISAAINETNSKTLDIRRKVPNGFGNSAHPPRNKTRYTSWASPMVHSLGGKRRIRSSSRGWKNYETLFFLIQTPTLLFLGGMYRQVSCRLCSFKARTGSRDMYYRALWQDHVLFCRGEYFLNEATAARRNNPWVTYLITILKIPKFAGSSCAIRRRRHTGNERILPA